MKYYAAKVETAPAACVLAEDLLLTKELPTAAGSKMLQGYVSLFEAEVLTRLAQAGYTLGGKVQVGEFGIDLVGETAYQVENDEILQNPSAELLKEGSAQAVLGLDVNGAMRRASAQNGLVSIKPTYGTVSRYGTIPVACSGETVSVMAREASVCQEILRVIAGHDDKDGTSLSDELCAKVKGAGEAPHKVALLNSLADVGEDVKETLTAFQDFLAAKGISVSPVESELIASARAAWNILMSAELCNNVSRYDGVKYGYRTENFSNLDELYTNSRTEAFGELLKTVILFGSETLSTENYQKVYDKALRMRRLICEEFEKLFADYDLVLLPACSSLGYPKDHDPFLAFEENRYTAPASITGLPALTVGGVQLIGKAFSEPTLFALAELYEKEGK